ncbi:hypothetical protein BCV73_08725 [Paenibacillus sp. SSG-1]|uniref:hypothetical protein n=1 Tax=Paenibacillus sp. SSG-1 TaxID=1443669 RepID=UPI000B7F04FC|nr:hypothetical protein [Paenibacillus sp. SSG-1]OXL83152.1 hypothetical protein BCV73_08725 [Paenibacillus sp. SSG-1]
MKNNGLNIKGLCKQIKASRKNMMWSLNDGVHTITDRYWMAQFKEIPKEVQIELYAIFAQFPEEGMHIRYDRFSDSILKGVFIDHTSILDGANKGEPAKDTRFSYDLNGMTARVFKRDDIYSYVNEGYLLAVKEYDGEILMTGKMQPVYFKDASYLVLPYRMGNAPEKEVLELFTK